MKNAKLLVLALLVVLLACVAVSASAAPHEGSHVWNELVENYQAPGCETQGWRYYQCSIAGCGETRIDYIAPLGHNWGPYEQVKEATCGKPGIQQQKCSRCGHYNTQTILYAPNATGAHDFSVVVKPALDPTCTTAGWKALIKCSVCGAVDPNNDGSAKAATGHDVTGKEWEVEREAACNYEGSIVQKCKKCFAVVNRKSVPKNGNHNFNQVLPAKEPTCTSTGCCALWQCLNCGATDTAVRLGYVGNYRDGRSIPALGHKWGAPVTEPATCTKAGMTVMTCERCGHIQKIAIPATGHSATWIPKDVQADHTIWTLRCGICGGELATQIVYKGEKAPSGTVNTGKADKDINYSANVNKVTETAKKSTKKTTAKKTTTTKTTATKATPAVTTSETPATVEGTKLVAGINTLEDKAVVVVKDGKATLVYAEADVIVKIGEIALEANVPVDVAADAVATIAAADAAATK